MCLTPLKIHVQVYNLEGQMYCLELKTLIYQFFLILTVYIDFKQI